MSRRTLFVFHLFGQLGLHQFTISMMMTVTTKTPTTITECEKRQYHFYQFSTQERCRHVNLFSSSSGQCNERRALDAHRIMKPFRHQLLLWTRRATRCGWLRYKINHFHWFVFASEMYIPWRVWREPILLMDFPTWCALVFFNVLRYPAPINKFFVKARHFLWYFVCFFFIEVFSGF